MKAAGHLILLGTGASMGVPMIGCHCSVCNSSSPYNKRLRTSALCVMGKLQVLIDCGPDFRQQALVNRIEHLDGVIFTHSHNDHTAGVDDLKIYAFYNNEPLDCLLSQETYDELKARYHYIFDIGSYAGTIPRFQIHLLREDRGELLFQQMRIRFFSYEQTGMKVYGFRFGNLAYVSDIRVFPETIFEDLEGVETLVLSALRWTPSPMHFHIDDAVQFAQRSGAKKTWLTHISHELDHEKTNAYLPENIRMAYDGLQLDFE
jgi:phosphoribosyl 1,2-cyclic phosphate phosphodiesterase